MNYRERTWDLTKEPLFGGDRVKSDRVVFPTFFDKVDLNTINPVLQYPTGKKLYWKNTVFIRFRSKYDFQITIKHRLSATTLWIFLHLGWTGFFTVFFRTWSLFARRWRFISSARYILHARSPKTHRYCYKNTFLPEIAQRTSITSHSKHGDRRIS